MSQNKREELLIQAEDCCDEIVEAAKRSAEVKKEYHAVNQYLDDIRKIKELDEKTANDLKKTARRIQNLKMDKEEYKSYGTKIPEKMYEYIRENENEMPKIMKELQEDEKYEQALKTDLNHIKGEKTALEYEKSECEASINRIRILSFFILGLAALMLGFFGYFHLVAQYDCTIGILVTVAVTTLFLAIFLGLYQKKAGELKLNERKRNKAVGMYNKYTLRYVNMHSRVDYSYRKLRINSTYELSNYWRLYLVAKKERQAYHQMSEEMYREQEHYTALISRLSLYDASVWNYQMNALVEEAEMQELVENLENRKKGLRKTLDYNKKRSEKCKQKIKEIIKEEPGLTEQVLKIVEEREG